jgi:hypothetical protein
MDRIPGTVASQSLKAFFERFDEAMRSRCSARPTALTTSSITSPGKTRVSNPTDTKSDNRRSKTGFTHSVRAGARVFGAREGYRAGVLDRERTVPPGTC